MVSHKDIERGGWGLFPEPQSRVLDTDVLPADVLEGLATVQLQLPVLSQQGPSGSQGSVTVRAAALLAFLRERCTAPDHLRACAVHCLQPCSVGL